MANKAIIESLKAYITLLNAEGISVNKAFLYGSHAIDTGSAESDIDIMIVSDNYDEADDFTAGKIWNLTRKINPKIEPFLIGIKKFSADDSSPLISMVKKSGVAII